MSEIIQSELNVDVETTYIISGLVYVTAHCIGLFDNHSKGLSDNFKLNFIFF